MGNFIFRSWPFVVLAVMALLVPNLTQAQCSLQMDHHIDITSSRRPPVVQGFINAMRTPGASARERAVRYFLQNVVSTADWRTKSALRGWLNRQYAEFDPRPYEDLLKKLGCSALLDRAELQRDRNLQLDFFARALSDGEASLPGGWSDTAIGAVVGAAEFGLVELEDDVESFYRKPWASDSPDARPGGGGVSIPGYNAKEIEETKMRFPFKTFLLDLKLHEGGKDYDECARLAAKRLAEMPAQEFRDHIENDAGFSGVFWNVAMYACAVNVFTGEQNDACEDIIKVYVHQWWLSREGEEEEGKAVWPNALRGLGGCMYQDVPFAAYAVTRDYFLTPGHREQIERARRHREEVREAQERKKVVAGQTVR